jgi:hypothetical protein
MPEISRFFGIVITMYFEDHSPPHFHARYGSFRAVIEISTGVVDGAFPRRGLALLEEWRELHLSELLEDWRLARAGQSLRKIEGLQ